MPKFHLFLNPVSGHKRGIHILKQTQELFEKAKIELIIHITEYEGHAIYLANSLSFEQIDGLCIIGGDGTIHEVINGMLSRSDNQVLPIGIIPAGTGNSLMHDLDILKPIDAIKRIIRGKLRQMDIFQTRSADQLIYGFNVLGWGIPVDVNILAEKMRWTRGQRYNIASLVAVIRNRIRPARIIIDQRQIEGTFGFIVACNTMYSGNGMKLAPPARIDDGLIDLLIVRKTSRLKLISLFTKIFKGTHFSDPVISHHQVSAFSIITEVPQQLSIDGQNIGHTPIHVEVLPDTVEIYG